ncbi:MAG: 5-methyltetrahydropteroyltriglutamate--homocysteine S-methyltransferase [Alphaproteobacteria bacterium]|nr:5-methyltetrahydropteroyltriglutamate--homocysteine S-methyltransferase [Alphaproteobacteria bacterium]
MVKAANLGFPRVGLNRELKKAQEAYWKGQASLEELEKTAKELRARHWNIQKDAGIEVIPSNDFSMYDQVLDTIAMVGAIPERYNWDGGQVDLDLFFAMARGRQEGSTDVVAMEMTKWFDTNYHYIVPEFKADTQFKYSRDKAVKEFEEAKALGIETRPVLLGPVSFLLLGKTNENMNALALLDRLLPVYEEVLQKLEAAGAKEVQIDEGVLVLDLEPKAKMAFKKAYDKLAEASGLKITIATYFGDLRDNLDVVKTLKVAGLHVDLMRAPEQIDDVIKAISNGIFNDKTLSVGVVDGRNIWKTDLAKALAKVEKAVAALGSDRVQVAPSCSLLHSPVDLDVEDQLDDELKNWLAFAKQKLQEVKLITDAVNGNKDEAAFEANKAAFDSRGSSSRIHNPAVKDRVSGLTDADAKRNSPFDVRIEAQRELLGLPILPTTTIGSFPQTQDVRQARAKFKKGELSRADYDSFLEQKTKEAMEWQDAIDIDVPVHGEFERNDMVEYFGEKLDGFAFTKNGWVQSYGSRCVKPPIIFGDVSRPKAMTVRWSSYAQAQTKRPVKGMLTGPVTILQWSFVRDDQPRETTCKQISLAIRDEVHDLEKANIRVIQIDEPALREGLPLRKSDWDAYLKWAVDSFKISSSGIEDATQIHTHMCYCEFNDIIDSIAALDADVISIETSRSAMELLDAFVNFKYPNEIGPGVYDIHSPRIPSQDEMEKLLTKALDVLDARQIWVNPDCGLKTRGWEETKPALEHMVAAAKSMRAKIEQEKAA